MIPTVKRSQEVNAVGIIGCKVNQNGRIRMEAVIVLINIRAILVVAFASFLFLQTGCDSDGELSNLEPEGQSSYKNVSLEDAPQLAIGSFNIKGFGKAKMSKPGVVQVLTDIVRRFDILAIQELREKDQNVIPEFLRQINANGEHSYAASVGPRQGYGRYFEQTVFIYDTKTVQLIGKTFEALDQTGPNGQKTMFRPPFVARFRALGVPVDQAFHFVLMNVHVRPEDEIPEIEFAVLPQILAGVYQYHSNEDDFILLGDLNDEPNGFQAFRWMNNQQPALASGVKTNTALTKSYDNLVFDSVRTTEFSGRSGVINLMEDYKLTYEDAKLVSDHMPVWGLFSAIENPSGAITQTPGSLVR